MKTVRVADTLFVPFLYQLYRIILIRVCAYIVMVFEQRNIMKFLFQ